MDILWRSLSDCTLNAEAALFDWIWKKKEKKNYFNAKSAAFRDNLDIPHV